MTSLITVLTLQEVVLVPGQALYLMNNGIVWSKTLPVFFIFIEQS